MNPLKSIKNLYSKLIDLVTHKYVCVREKMIARKEKKRKERAEKQYAARIRSMTFKLRPELHYDTLVVLRGRMVRIQFTTDAVKFEDILTGELISEQLEVLELLKELA